MFMRMKYLGLALLAFAAFACASAGAASATIVHDFQAGGSSTAVITGAQRSESEAIKYEFGPKWTLTCGASNVNGTVSGLPSSSLTLSFTHTKCLLNELAAVVDSEGCHYVFSGVTDAEGHGAVELECEPTKPLRVTVSGCTIEIGGQKFTEKGASYEETTENNGFKDMDVKVTTFLGTYKKSGILCETIAGTGADLSVRGTYTMTAYEDAGGGEGKQVNFTTKQTVV